MKIREKNKKKEKRKYSRLVRQKNINFQVHALLSGQGEDKVKLQWRNLLIGITLFLLISALGIWALYRPAIPTPPRVIIVTQVVEVTREIVVTATLQPTNAATNTPTGKDPIWWTVTGRKLYLLTNLEIPADKWVGVRLINKAGEEWYIGDTRSNRSQIYRWETQVEQDWYTGEKIPAGTYTAEVFVCDEMLFPTWDGTPQQPQRVNFRLLGETVIEIPK